ncbi:uncharacterized protein LOC123558770 [Mercenaria mercenaria]|uniref:uncharacterized protein LOC123558770 n=1 Tax=Mercenaria mercenaria TaxID=6596 RepID=UPI00234F822F|nr:uncharacterized protein LOC123558770 [Mercenaria mercenaria]
MSKSLSYEDLGSDDVVVDVCPFCATKDKIEQANHFCYDCGVFGRYIYDNCTENHDIITASEDHDVRTFSGETNIRRENLDEFNDIEMRHRAEVEQLEQEKDEDIMEFKEQINQLSLENTKNRAEITHLNQQKEKQDIKIGKLVQEKNEQYDHFKMQWEHQMGKVDEIYRNDTWARENEIQTYQNEIEKLEEGKQEMIIKFEAQAHELLEENANLQSDVERLNEEKEKLEAKIRN